MEVKKDIAEVDSKNVSKIRVLWFCNVVFSAEKSRSSGSWLHAMSLALIESGKVDFYNVTMGYVNDVTKNDYGTVNQWVIPYPKSLKDGLPGKRLITAIQKIVQKVNPDIIHIWGTENFWGLLTSRDYIRGNVILEIQGLKFAIEKYFYAGLDFRDIIRCFGIKEFLKPSGSLIGLRSSFKKWGEFEKEMIRNHSVISVQSEWARSHVKYLAPQALLVDTTRSLRPEFKEADRWNADTCIPFRVFTSFASVVSYKGLHVLLYAVSLLKQKYPEIKLVIAGAKNQGIRQDGYTRWVLKKITRLGISENVEWIGLLDAGALIKQLQSAHVVAIPSFIESFCLALYEALAVGVPCVASFAGAMPELAQHEKEAVFFQPGDSRTCARYIEKIFSDKDFANMISQNAYDASKSKNAINIADLQLSIYKYVRQ